MNTRERAPFSLIPLGLALALTLFITGCTVETSNETSQLKSADGVNFSSYEDAEPPDSLRPAQGSTADPLRNELGRFFLVEHFSAEVHESMKRALTRHPPAGLLFWNQNNASSGQIQGTIAEYSKTVKDANKNPVLFSTDYEGGGLMANRNGRSVPGVQRFKEGFTLLPHPVWLGRTLKKYKTEACALHAEIIADELISVGVNFPLTVVSDLSEKLFALRGISKDPRKVADCVTRMLEVFAQKKYITFVTKHFPGLSSVHQDTHDQTGISSIVDVKEFQKQLWPFQSLISWAEKNKARGSLTLMISHAVYPIIDATTPATESERILKNLLRDQLNYAGLTLSDAMWMGGYGPQPPNELMITYLHSIFSGMDVLMIPGSKFSTAMKFFRGVYDGRLDQQQINDLEAAFGLPFSEIRLRLVTRLHEVLQRLHEVQNSVGYAQDHMTSALPVTLTTEAQTRYFNILKDVGYPFSEKP